MVIARRGFEKDLYTYEDVFSDIRQSPFTIREASEYLEVAEITVRRWVSDLWFDFTALTCYNTIY